MSAPSSSADPGWRPVLKHYLLTVATFGIYARRHRDRTDGLTVLRIVWLSVLCAVALIGIVLVLIVDDLGAPGALAVIPILTGIGAVAYAAWSARRPLEADSAEDLARSYNSAFFVAFVIAEAPVLISVVIAFGAREFWPYALALPFFCAAMALIAPGPGGLARRQRELDARGSTLSLRDALVTQTPAR